MALGVSFVSCSSPYSDEELISIFKTQYEKSFVINEYVWGDGIPTIEYDPESIKLDVYYVDNMSFGLDVKIFFTTLKNVLLRVGINSSEDNTMEPFKGTPKAEEQPTTVAAGDAE